MAKFRTKDGVGIIPKGTKVIEDGAFAYRSSLKSVIIPDSVIVIGSLAFEGCTSIESIVVAEGNPVYDSREGCNAIIETKTNTLITGCGSTIIPESVTKIRDKAFAGCSSLKRVRIPDSVTVIGPQTFEGCTSLELVVIPNSVTAIETRAFYGCTSLENVVIPKSVTKIGLDSFSGCISLESVTLLSRAELYNGLFANCPSLQTINVPSDYVDYYKEYLPEELHDKIVELDR